MVPRPLSRTALAVGALALLGGCATLAGCSTGPLVRDAPEATRPDAFPNHSVATILAAVASEAQPLQGFASQSRIKVERPGQKATLTARLRQTPDSLFGVLSGPFGIRVGEGLVTPDSFYVDFSFGNAYYVGALASAGRLLPIPPTTMDLFASLTGTVTPNTALTWTAQSDTTHYILDARIRGSDTVVQRHVIDPALWRVVEATDFGLDGTVLGTRTFSAFDQVDNHVLPRRIVLRAPQEDATVTIEHLSATPNPETLSFPRPDPNGSSVTVVD